MGNKKGIFIIVKKNTRNILIYLIIIIVLITLLVSYLSYNYFSYKYDFTNSIYVITEDEVNSNITYYEVNDRNVKRKVNKFQSDDMIIYNAEYNCFDRFENTVNWDKCLIFDDNDNIVEMNEYFMDIINLVSKIDHDIIRLKIISINNEYYVVVELNVNLWTPYDLYKYDKTNKILKLIYTFDGEDVIGIKIKE